ncbi:MAG TPA: InlB B-repeat-containing protein [Candidatus Dojkabacteria bacterium]|nr:InlB B-repeat-containing protein [Candidatus Dojkabacteria bacterium]
MSKVVGANKKVILIALVIGVFLFGGGYLLWRVNQEDTVAPTDSDASEENCVLRCLPDAICVARDANDNCAEDEAGICYYAPYGGSKTGCCAYERICNVTAYYITYVAGQGGRVTNAGQNNVAPGGSISSTATPNTGYRFVKWSDNKTTATRTDSNVQADATYTATFEVLPAEKVTLTYVAGSGGTITGTTPQIIDKGASGTAVTATPNAGYRFVKWSDNKTTATRTDTNVQASATYTATFEVLPADKVVLTYIAGSGGTITGTTPQIIDKGASGTAVTAHPLKGCNCRFVKWSDGKTTATRTDTNVQASAKYTAQFQAQAVAMYWLEIYVSPVGSGEVLGLHGQDMAGEKFHLPPPSTKEDAMIAGPGNPFWAKAVPKPGYRFVRWQDGQTDSIRLETITRDTVWTAIFETLPADRVVLTYVAGSGGTITGIATQEINKGASGTAVTATPDVGYTFEKWSDGNTTAVRTDSNVQESATYTATFKSTDTVPQAGIFDDTENTIILGVVVLIAGLEWTWISSLPMKAYNAISVTSSKMKEDSERKRVQRRRSRLEKNIK